MQAKLFELIVVTCTLLLVGVTTLFAPITVIRLFARYSGPKAWLTPRTRELMKVLFENPDEYARRFTGSILMVRVIGCGALLMFLVALLILAATLAGFGS